MMEFLLTRHVVIGCAALGGVFSVLAIALQTKGGREKLVRQMNIAGYIFMGISMLLFVIIGLRGSQG